MTEPNATEVDQLAINTLRFLAVDMVEKAQSGHPGAPMGQASMGYLLWSRYLRHNPRDPRWPNRDRFVLSCGHASALIYGLLHLSGYDLPMEELENFRQWGSKTAGHPEYHLTPGVETTTGPLGQGLTNAVGMALARQILAARFNRDGFPIFDYRTWVLASDGDLMEGITSEASSWAGHLRLGSLKVLYDSNGISIDGSTDLAFSEDVGARYRAYGWNVLTVEDGNDLEALGEALDGAVSEETRPTLVVVNTHIGFGSPNKQDSASSHGAPLGVEEVIATKKNLGWPPEPSFLVPDGVREAMGASGRGGAELQEEWTTRLEAYREAFPELAAELTARMSGQLRDDWQEALPTFEESDGPLATRKASGRVLNALKDVVPELVGGSADLTGSNNTFLDGETVLSAAEPGGRNLYFGVREHAMGGVLNGMALSGMLRPYGGTFLIFSDYMRPAIRLAALMGLPAIYVLTHDSIFLGEDGPTHQPISQLASLRSIPNLTVIRPADANETAAAWAAALRNTSGPTALVLTRQKLPILEATRSASGVGVERGGYVVVDCEGTPELILIATGSEVALAVEAQQQLASSGRRVRLVSLPSWELFAAQESAYREEVLPSEVTARLAIEAASPFGWERYVGSRGGIVGVESFGASAPYQDLAREFGFTVERVVEAAEELL